MWGPLSVEVTSLQSSGLIVDCLWSDCRTFHELKQIYSPDHSGPLSDFQPGVLTFDLTMEQSKKRHIMLHDVALLQEQLPVQCEGALSLRVDLFINYLAFSLQRPLWELHASICWCTFFYFILFPKVTWYFVSLILFFFFKYVQFVLLYMLFDIYKKLWSLGSNNTHTHAIRWNVFAC